MYLNDEKSNEIANTTVENLQKDTDRINEAERTVGIISQYDDGSILQDVDLQDSTGSTAEHNEGGAVRDNNEWTSETSMDMDLTAEEDLSLVSN